MGYILWNKQMEEQYGVKSCVECGEELEIEDAIYIADNEEYNLTGMNFIHYHCLYDKVNNGDNHE